MNNLPLSGPCADYEHDLVELLEGTLGAERARVIRLHVDACARCRTWQTEFAAFDARLTDALPKPSLSADFEQRLQARLAAAATPARRGDLRTAADREHERLIEALGRGVRRHVLLDAVGSVAATAGVLLAARGLLEPAAAFLQTVVGPPQWVAMGVVGAAVTAAALAWSAARGVLPLAGLRR